MTFTLAQRVIDAFLPKRELPPDAQRRLRFLAGSSLVGLFVASISMLPVTSFGFDSNAAVILAFAVGVLLLLSGIRAGVSLQFLSFYALGLVGVFLFAVSLLTAQLQWRQLQWFILLPLISLLLGEPGDGTRRSRATGLFGISSAAAIVLGLLVVVFSHLGLTLGVTDDVSGLAAEIAGSVDFVMFIVSVTGLLYVHHLALQRAETEVARLREMLSVCAWCGRLRDDTDGWVSIEHYMRKHAAAQLSHGICPSCEARITSEMSV